MTSQKDQIQRLIAEIEATLAKPSSRLPLGLSGEAERQRQLLGKLFSYLQSLQQMFDAPGGWGPIDPGTGQFVSPQATAQDMEESASQVLQGLLLEMRYLRENSLKPMRQELESLQQKRDSLQAEINVLEAQQGADPLQSEQQINAFLETLMQRLQEQLSAQMVQNFAAMEAASVEQLSAADNPSLLLSGQRLEQVRLLQAQSDQLLLKLDTTLTAVFDSLQKSVDSYRESLEEGLDQMHGLGRQGEVIFHAFINHLAQQLGQDASSYLTGELAKASALQDPDTVTADVDLDAAQLDELNQALENLALEESLESSDDIAAAIPAIDSDLVLPDDKIAPADNANDDSMLSPLNDETELGILEEAIFSDEDITVIQTDSDLEQALETDLDEEITIIQADNLSDQLTELEMLEEAISPSNNLAVEDSLAAEDSDEPPLFEDATDLETASASLNLELPLENIDESFDLLAVGAEAAVDEASGAINHDDLPQVASQNELFSFDADIDFESGLEPDTTVEEAPDSFSENALFPLETPDSEGVIAEQAATIALPDADADQIADSWLLEQLSTQGMEGDAASQDWLAVSSEPDLVAVDSPENPKNIAAEITVETLFGDSINPQDDLSNEEPGEDIVGSLAEVLPDASASGAVEDLSEDVSDDGYIAASADEDLISLSESGAEQRLLIDFDDGQLIEQLDEDLQKLAGENFSTDYGVEDDEALEPLDQATLETIVRDLNLEEDLTLGTDPLPELAEPDTANVSQETNDLEAASSAAENTVDEAVEALLQQSSEEQADFDLFEGFGADVIDIDDPSASEIDVASMVTSVDMNQGTQDLDLLGLVADPDELTDLDELDDGLTDSLADELGSLSERSNALSQEQADEVIGQFISDLEEPVIGVDEIVEVPTMGDLDPRLESASVPDLPSDLLMDDGTDSPEADDFLQDDFLQAEQEAFWQTMAEDDKPAQNFSVADSSDESTSESDDIEANTASLLAADDLDDLLVLDDLPLLDQEPVEADDIDLRGLDELFGQSVPELEALNQETSDSVDEPMADPLAALELDAAPSPATLPEPLLPDIDLGNAQELDNLDVDVAAAAALDIEQTLDSSATQDVEIPTPPVAVPTVDLEGDWFLGLDVGATGLSAVLMNRRIGQVYPLYWQMTADESETKHFRLPAMAFITLAQETVAVGYDALGDLEDVLKAASTGDAPELLEINRLKPLLKVAVGHGQTLRDSEPWLRWSDTVELPMLQVLQAMVALLRHVMDQGKVVGLERNDLEQVWEKLQGVIVGYPTNWPDTYSFNLREAVLAAGLIKQPEQVVFVEDAIATILSGLPDPRDVTTAETVSLSRQPSLYNCQWQEGTVVISGGAVMTELGLVNLPKDLTGLNYADFALRGFAYAGDALDQDIVCQLLLPDERRQPLTEVDNSISWDWQGYLANEDADWCQLRLDGLTLPAVGHVDWAQRYQLQQRLLASNLGQSLLAAARHLKLALQHQNRVQISLAGQKWLIKRRHLENLIFLPYIQRINRYLNVLLSQHTVDTQAIKQVICTGGSASLPAIARWLRQKFPNATIVQDTYASELPHSCSRVAYGLVNLARYPQVLNITRQQYSDYFLLMELLRVFPQQPLPVGAIMHLLEQRGINTQACHLHILALLEGHLPPGLVPTAADRGLICDRTADLSTYRALLQTPLFTKTVTESGGQMYIPNEAQAEQLRAYVQRLLIDKAQTLEEPLIAHLEVLV